MAKLCRSKRRFLGFTLAEVLLAIFYISIAFFAYAALHQRLIFSGTRTRGRVVPREEARTELINTMRLVYAGGSSASLKQVEGVNDGLYIADGKNSTYTAVKVGNQEFYKVENNNPSYRFDSLVTKKRGDVW